MSRFSKTAPRLWRDPDHAILSGVCAGLAHYFGFAPVLVRVACIILLLLMPLIVISSYILLSWLLPTRPHDLYADAQAESRASAIHRNPHETLINLRTRLARIERQLRRVEARIGDEEYELAQKFRNL